MNNNSTQMRNIDWLFRSKSQNRFLFIMILKFLFFIFGLITIFFEVLGDYSAPILIVLYVITECTLLNFNKTRSTWESFHRELEINESFGRPITKHIDILPSLSNKEKVKVESNDLYGGTYFSNNSSGIIPSLKNLLESSWWSKHLAGVTSKVYMVITLCIVTLSLAAFFQSIQFLSDSTDIQAASKIIVSFIFMVFSMDFIRHWHGYNSFQLESEKIENKCRDLIRNKNQDEMVAYSLWVEYQFSRSQAPLIPQAIWLWKRKSLNEIWGSLN